MGKPDVTRPERIADLEQDGDLPEAVVTELLRIEMAMPFRALAQECGLAGR